MHRNGLQFAIIKIYHKIKLHFSFMSYQFSQNNPKKTARISILFAWIFIYPFHINASHLAIITCRTGWKLFDSFLKKKKIRLQFICFAYRLNILDWVYAFLRLCEGHITIPTVSHQLQSNRPALKFLTNTTFLVETTTNHSPKTTK